MEEYLAADMEVIKVF